MMRQRRMTDSLYFSMKSFSIFLLFCPFLFILFFVVISTFLPLHVLFPYDEVECPEDGKFRLVCASCSCLLRRVVSCVDLNRKLRSLFVVFLFIWCVFSHLFSFCFVLFFFTHTLILLLYIPTSLSVVRQIRWMYSPLR